MTDPHEPPLAGAGQPPVNLGELPDADAVGTVGNAACGEMLRMWIKFREEHGRRVIDRATFQSFGCETAIAVASLATELIRGKTPAEALALGTGELAGELGPLPPMRIHCAELVEGALRAALEPAAGPVPPPASPPEPAPGPGNLRESLLSAQPAQGRPKVVLLGKPPLA